ncbi:hypothetical protein N4R57_12530 [Rhodobacteraceae bacterium D3-12]|nr:hypothetical protein N4R57_12530 [Rhodobacteraceae bacterium D3-12]
MSLFRHLWSHHRPSLIVFLVAAAASLFFIARLVAFTVYWSDPAHRNLVPEAWMTPGYVAHSWGRDPRELALAIGAPPDQRVTLHDIARTRGISAEQLLTELQTLLSEGPGE